MTAVYIVLGVAVYRASNQRAKYPLHMLQLEGYSEEEYKNWIRENGDRIKAWRYAPTSEKTPLVMTDRAKRLFAVHRDINSACIALAVVVSAIVCIVHPVASVVVFVVLCLLIYYFQYAVLIRANRINYPREMEINRGFFVEAQEKVRELKKRGLNVVGITGSFGKTSTKFITSTVLEKAFRVQNTPSSYNTPMGLSKVINNDLDEDDEIFLAELGAKEPGEIEEVAELVQPSIGIITAIGPTHMHLFKTIENIQKTKYELIEALDKGDVAIFNYDNDYVKPLADKTVDQRVIRYGMENIERLDVYAKDVAVHERGSSFTLGFKDKGEVCAETKLLGKHNISNLLAAASVGYVLGMDPEAISRGISKVEPVEHRLNIVDGGTGVIVIDDAFNSNPVGARAALDVLSAFKSGKKIIVTPGMVELGAMEEEENYKLGGEIAKVVDYAILVGKKRTEPIQRGLKDAGFDEEKTIVAANLDEATASLGSITAPGDIVLFENDLPDTYDEG
ncbi:MAG: UDP-N-acetylmuramoyl-tripeptide--D-alanyl-D-alanine ligase [Firmicutes bacterium]|nr:UDP-N-acetylmuramoyl-tripeptide--D-alanyl-D-alanine ligase [Bacillota bacterium]